MPGLTAQCFSEIGITNPKSSADITPDNPGPQVSHQRRKRTQPTKGKKRARRSSALKLDDSSDSDEFLEVRVLWALVALLKAILQTPLPPHVMTPVRSKQAKGFNVYLRADILTGDLSRAKQRQASV